MYILAALIILLLMGDTYNFFFWDNKKCNHKNASKIVVDLSFQNIKIFNFMAGEVYNLGSTGTLHVKGENDANVERPINTVTAVSTDTNVVTVTPIEGTNDFALNFVGNGTADINMTAKNSPGADLPPTTVSVTVAAPVQEATHIVATITQP